MKVLLCERMLVGHRRIYLEYLSKIEGVEIYCFAPENIGVSDDHFIRYDDDNQNRYIAYFCWIRQIKKSIRDNHIDLVHITDGDSIRRFFGMGFSSFGVKTVVTYHHFFMGKISALSYRMMSGGKRISVVHTKNVRDEFQNIGVKNISVVEYPAFSFNEITKMDSLSCKKHLCLPTDVPTIGIVGGLVNYKRIPQFLRVMNGCKSDFRLLICGMPKDITEEELFEAIKAYKDKVFLLLRKLTDEEYNEAIVASDIIYNIYGAEFDGASGPLTDGVCAKKMILASSHGSLGQIVRDNHLGITCDCMDEDAVLEAVTQAVDGVKSFVYDETATSYRNKLKPGRFQSDYKTIYTS